MSTLLFGFTNYFVNW